MTEIESGSVAQMVDSSSTALLAEINSKANKPLIWPWIFAASIGLLAFNAMYYFSIGIYCALVVVCCVGLLWAVRRDSLRKTVVLLYELEPQIERAYQNLHLAFASLVDCSRFWHIDAQGKVGTTYDRKVNAGASYLVKRKAAEVSTSPPQYFKSNILIPSISTERRQLYFLPDRVLVRDPSGFGAVRFNQLRFSSWHQRFIEAEGVPSDSKVVDRTWRYVNKKGGPDRRFNNNREIPVVLYNDMLFESNNGLDELFEASKVGIGDLLSAAFKEMASVVSERENPQTDLEFAKSPCLACGLHIEYPIKAKGAHVACPQCGKKVVL